MGEEFNRAILVMLFAPYAVFGSIGAVLLRHRIRAAVQRWRARLRLRPRSAAPPGTLTSTMPTAAPAGGDLRLVRPAASWPLLGAALVPRRLAVAVGVRTLRRAARAAAVLARCPTFRLVERSGRAARPDATCAGGSGWPTSSSRSAAGPARP